MITPLDIENKKFSKQMMNGYSVEEVDDFLDELTADYGKNYKEITELKAKVEYCYDDEDISMMKLHAIENANVFNSLAEDDLDKQHEVLSEI